jgi:hypothetical protein
MLTADDKVAEVFRLARAALDVGERDPGEVYSDGPPPPEYDGTDEDWGHDRDVDGGHDRDEATYEGPPPDDGDGWYGCWVLLEGERSGTDEDWECPTVTFRKHAWKGAVVADARGAIYASGDEGDHYRDAGYFLRDGWQFDVVLTGELADRAAALIDAAGRGQ